METKPFSIQSPEQIAKDYGGNKQKIAEAMQMGVLDATAGTLAGMFIDRIRNAAQAEAAPQQSVAQQVFAPPMPVAPGAGLAGTPQAAAMQAPPMAPPGAPPPAGLAAAPMPAPGMAAGGLTTLPLPDGMFDEPDYGGYRGGGLVAFAAGELVEADPETGVAVLENPDDNILVERLIPNPKEVQGMRYAAPLNFGSLTGDWKENLEELDARAPRQTEEAGRYQEYLNRVLSPEEQRARRQEDMWMALGQIGARMATTPGSLLQAVSTGVGEALPGIREAATARRGEERSARQALLAEERTGNAEVMARTNVAMDMLRQYNTLEQAFQDQNFNNTLTRLGIDAGVLQNRISAGASIRGAMISAASQERQQRMALQQATQERNAAAIAAAREYFSPGNPGHGAAREAQQAGTYPQLFESFLPNFGYRGDTLPAGFSED